MAGGTIGPLQLCILAILILLTLTGLYYTTTGETVPTSVTVMFFGGICVVVGGVFQSFGGFKSKEEVDPEVEADNLFERRKLKRDAKKDKKEAQKAQEEADAEAEKAQKKATKLQAQKEAKEKARVEAETKRLEEEKKRQEEEEEKKSQVAKKAKKPKKPKKEKEAKETAPAAPVAQETSTPAPAVAEVETKALADDWVVQPSQKEIRDAKKANKEEAAVEYEMLVNSKHYPALIGEAGTVRTKIEQVCGVKITFPRRNSGDEKIKLEGTEAAIALTRQIIHEIIDKGFSSTLDANATVCKIQVLSSCVGLLLANKGMHAKALRTKTGARIEFPEKETKAPEKPKEVKEKTGRKGKKGDKDHKEEADDKKDEEAAGEDTKKQVEVSLYGDQTQISQAIDAIRQLEKEGFSEITHEGHVKTVVGFPASLIGTLMGERGAKLQELQKRSHTRIQVPTLERENKPTLIEITITGKPADVEAARREIVSISTNIVTREVDIPQALVFPFLGPQGQAKLDLQRKTNTRIDVGDHLWNPAEKTVSISGADKGIQEVVKVLQDLMTKNNIFTFDFPTDRLPALIGKAGEKIQKLQAETKTRINCEDHDWDKTVKKVTIVGPDDNIAAARAVFAKLLEPPPQKKKKTEGKEDVPEEASSGEGEEAAGEVAE